MMRRPAVLALVVLFTAACADKPAGDAPPRSSAPAAATVAQGGTLTGTVREQIPVGPYVYLRLETEGGEQWAAVNETSLAIGDSVTVYNVMKMEQFASETLGRTFDEIYFGTVDPSGGVPAGSMSSGGSMPDAMMAPLPASAPMPAGAHPPLPPRVGPIPRATGANARTIGELWGAKEQLAGASVTVRGVVVKYNPDVMGKNWIHLQDGSGNAGNGTNDLTVNSLETAAVGDTVTISGTVRLNQDLGAGYLYPLLVENATLVKR
jgi:hypothetical protein